MHLSADSVDDLSVGVDTLDEGDHSLDLGVVGVEVVVVDVQPKVRESKERAMRYDHLLGVGVCSPRILEGQGDERLQMASER